MKIALGLFLVSGTASAFTTTQFGIRRSTLLNSRVDASDAIKAALEASEKFGATSTEARVAWDVVEELDSADNSAAYQGGVTDEECLTDENSAACKEYEKKLAELAELLEENKARIDSVRTLASDIQAIKITTPTSTSNPNSEELRNALDAAKAASETHGAASTEAKLAWETVEEIAAAGTSVETLPSLYDECLVDALEACEALDELARVIEKSKN